MHTCKTTLQALPLLQSEFPIQRARMRLRLSAPAAARPALGALLRERGAVFEAEADAPGGGCSMTVLVEPGLYREVHALMQNEAQHQGSIEVLSFAVTVEGDEGDEYGRAAPARPAAAAAAAVAGAAATGGGTGAGAAGAARPSGAAAAAAARRAGAASNGSGGVGGGGEGGRVVYERGPISELPEEFASRRERFAELDGFQPGWLVELRERGDTVDAVFYSPAGERVGPFAAARRQALQWKQRLGQ
jgi:ribosome maturation protein SDO1